MHTVGASPPPPYAVFNFVIKIDELFEQSRSARQSVAFYDKSFGDVMKLQLQVMFLLQASSQY